MNKLSKMAAMLAALFASSTLLGGCAAVLVGGLFYNSSKTYEQKQKFTADFQHQNLEREKAALKPLDWCSETYKFDKVWAAEGAGCAERIARYEKGDRTALALGDGAAG